MQRALLGTAVCVTALVGVAAGPASAGEITGTGSSLHTGEHTLHGKSICAFSGLNDDYIAAKMAGTPTAGIPHVQTPAEAPPGVAGQACNPNNPPPTEP